MRLFCPEAGQESLAASRQKVMRGMAVAAGAAYSIGRMFEKSMDIEEQVIRLRTVINAEDADAAVGRSIAHTRETARKSLASESELLQIQYELNSAGLDEQAAQVGSDIVAKVAKVTAGDAGGVAKVMAMVRNNMGGSMARIGDVLTQTQFKFAISDFGQLGEGMAEAAAGAVAAKLPLEQTAAAVGALNTAGLTGSRAGTALNALLRQMGPAADELGFAMVRGADGSLDLGATLEALNERLPDPADIDARNDAIQRLFGDEGKRGLVPLLADLDKYREGLQAVGQSEGVVDQSIQRFLDSSGGQWQMLTQNLTAVGAVLGGTMLPLVNSILTPMADFAGWVGALVERFPQLGHALGAAGLALTTFGGSWAAAAWFGKGQQFLGFAQGAAKAALGLARNALPFLGKAVMWVGRLFLTNPIVAAVAAIAGAAFLIYKYWDPIKAFFGKLWEWIKTATAAAWESGILPVILGPIGIVIRYWDEIKTFFGGLWDGLKETASMVWTAIAGSIGGAWGAYKRALNGLWGSIKGWWAGLDVAAIGRAFIETLAKGIRFSPVGLIYKALKSVLGFVGKLLPSSDAKEGPLSRLTAAGESILGTMGAGVRRAGEEGLRAPLAGALAGAALAAPAVGAASPAAAPTTYNITIHQQPGEDAQALVDRVIAAIEERRGEDARGALHD